MDMFVYSKDFPTFKVRRAITDEADNLVPLIERGQKKGLPLTDLPPSSHPNHPHALARLISMQNEKDHAVFIAEVYLLEPKANLWNNAQYYISMCYRKPPYFIFCGIATPKSTIDSTPM